MVGDQDLQRPQPCGQFHSLYQTNQRLQLRRTIHKRESMKNYFDNIKRYRAFSVKYRPATNFKSSRITIYDERLGERVTIPYDHSFDNPWQIAVTYLLNLPHPIQIESLGMSKDDSHVLLTTDFSTSMKQSEKKQAKNRLVNMDGTTEEFDGEY